MIVYPHHLMMDYAMPRWMLVMGQLISYTSGLPVFAVTAYGALAYVHRSGIRWSMPAMLVMLSMFGWAAGIVPAIIDGTISVNRVMHNTMWVPGHFHFYLLLGVLPMVLAFMYHLVDGPARGGGGSRLGLAVYVLGGLVFAFAFLAAGSASVPRRFAAHLPQWLSYDQAGSIGAILVIAATLIFSVRIVAGLSRAPRDAAAAHAAP
jgi:cytochrome c oxidase subunit 1